MYHMIGNPVTYHKKGSKRDTTNYLRDCGYLLVIVIKIFQRKMKQKETAQQDTEQDLQTETHTLNEVYKGYKTL